VSQAIKKYLTFGCDATATMACHHCDYMPLELEFSQALLRTYNWCVWVAHTLCIYYVTLLPVHLSHNFVNKSICTSVALEEELAATHIRLQV